MTREVDIPSNLKQFSTRFAIALFRAIRQTKRGLQASLGRAGHAMSPLGRFFVRYLILPIYRSIITAKLKFHRLALPTRGFVLYLLTNRYLFHGVVILLALITALANIQARQALAQDVGQRSLLFALATDRYNEMVEEAVNPETTSKNANYLGTATLIGIPHIDFIYEDETDNIAPNLVVPGTIAALPYEEPSEGPQAPRTKTETYTVQENDTISTIAQRYGVNVGTILWNNNLQERQYIRPGDTLRIPPVSGVLIKVAKGDTLNKIASRYGGDANEIASFNNLSLTDALQQDAELMVPGGKPPVIQQTRTQLLAKNTTAKTSSKEPVVAPSNIKKPADLDSKNQPKTRLLWPTSGRVITQYYGWKHIGLDIDGDYTSPLYASDDGVVVESGWSNAGYGLQILIDHENGYKTRYAHASKIFVKKGERVKRGQVIAMMGTTGRSTGTHIHYEVIINGKRVNPLSYIR